ncbi:TPA: DNA polymerase III subunit gamma/tau, partial [Pseudomonas aeruginosa]|nr:DNA polymerase III subunit gamma/tau [Pseudomonas aeruginosa]
EPEPEPEPEPLAVEAPSVPPAVEVEAVVETVLEALPAALPVAPDEQDEQDDEPPPADDYYEVDMDTLAYLDAAPEPDVVVVEEPLPAAKPATGLAAEWLELFPRLGLGGLTASIGANCTLVAADGDHWHLHLDPGQSALFNATQQRRLNDALNQHLGRTLKLEVTLQKPEQETPAQAAARRRAERQRAAEASIDADPLVRQLREQFAAVVRDGTIEPLEAKA